jgi:plasmid stabilization system protein ParE
LKRRVVVRPQARAELSEAAEWYRRKSPILATGFRSAVHESVRSISEWPSGFTEVSDGIRRALTTRFPYAIFFSEASGVIVVLAIKHQAQDPASWPKGE